MKMKSMFGFMMGAVGAAVLVSNAADAAILQYTFDAGAFYNFSGGTSNVVTGTFDYDTVGDTFSNVNYDRGGTIFTVASSTGPGAGPKQVFFGDTTSSNYDVYQFANSLAGGGVDLITAGYHPFIVIDAGGSVSTNGPGGGVPEPATWAMMLMGFGLLVATTRRRRGTSLVV